MPAYQNSAIDEAAFLEFVNAPSGQPLELFVAGLASDDQANSFFDEESPVWHRDPAAWVVRRLPASDWYSDLTEPEAVAWDAAIRGVVSAFDCSDAVPGMEHGAVDFDIFELAAKMFGNDKAKHQILRMHPYRFHRLAPEIESAEPYERVYWPTHAMLDTEQLNILAADLRSFRTQLPKFEITHPSIFGSIDDRRRNAEVESAGLLAYVSRLLDAKAMWFALIDC